MSDPDEVARLRAIHVALLAVTRRALAATRPDQFGRPEDYERLTGLRQKRLAWLTHRIRIIDKLTNWQGRSEAVGIEVPQSPDWRGDHRPRLVGGARRQAGKGGSSGGEVQGGVGDRDRRG